MHEIEEREQSVLALDLGGTKIVTALVTRGGDILSRETRLTLAEEGRESVIDRIFSSFDHLLSVEGIMTRQLHSISLASAGVIDIENGIVTSSPRLPGWQAVPLRRIIEEKYHVTTYLINDANAAALGEHRYGAGRGASNLIYITVSTGIGAGIIINGQLYSGASGGAGEIGHTTISVNGPRCNCGNTGCLEVLASGTAIAEEAIRRIHQGERTSLKDIVGDKMASITAEMVSAAAMEGDSLAGDIIRQASVYLGIGIVNLVNLFNPEVIIIGGGLSKIGDPLFDLVRSAVRERAFNLSGRAVQIVSAQLGDDSGVLGAAVFAFQ